MTSFLIPWRLSETPFGRGLTLRGAASWPRLILELATSLKCLESPKVSLNRTFVPCCLSDMCHFLDHELASPLPNVLDNNGILHTMTFDVTTVMSIVFEVLGSIADTLTESVRLRLSSQLEHPRSTSYHSHQHHWSKYYTNCSIFFLFIVIDNISLLVVTDCTEWIYDPTTGTTYTLCYDKEGKGSFIGIIDLNTYQVQYIGSEPLIPVPYLVSQIRIISCIRSPTYYRSNERDQYSSGSFTVNYKEGAAFVIQDSPHLEDTWLVKANLTTGERMSEMTVRVQWRNDFYCQLANSAGIALLLLSYLCSYSVPMLCFLPTCLGSSNE